LISSSGSKDPDELINFVKMLQPSFGGINLEDIASPKCFYVLERLRRECRIPSGTTTSRERPGNPAALFNALKIVRKKSTRLTW